MTGQRDWTDRFGGRRRDHIESPQLVMNYYNASFIKSHTHSVVDGINVVRFNCAERRLHLSEQRRIKKSAAQFHFHAATEVAFSLDPLTRGNERHVASFSPQYAATCRATEQPMGYCPSCTWSCLHMTWETTGWRRINRTIYFCCPSSVFLQQNTQVW